MRYTLLLFCALALAACDRPLIPGAPRYSREPGSGREGTDTSWVLTPGEHVYMTAVRFPDGFDWAQDTCAVEGTVWLDLYCDGQRVRSQPAGEAVHPDAHRFTGGHLYADYPTAAETVLLRDGEELFRFEGREAFRGFLVREDGIHTLGQDRDGDGLTYRIDGREAWRSPSGSVLGEPGRSGGALTEAGEDLYFCWTQSGQGGTAFQVMRGAEPFLSPRTSGEVFDLCVAGGKVYWTQFLRGRLSLVSSEGASVTMSLQAGEKPHLCRLFPGPDDLFVGAYALRGDDGRRYFVQALRGEQTSLEEGSVLLDILSDDAETGWLTGNSRGEPVRFTRSRGGTVSLPGGGFLFCRDCALLVNGHLYLALTGRDGAANRLVIDGKAEEFPFNGYFTSVVVE